MSFGLVDMDDGCLTFGEVEVGMSSSHSNAGPAFLKVTRPCAIMRKLSHNCDAQHSLTNPSYVLFLLLCASFRVHKNFDVKLEFVINDS